MKNKFVNLKHWRVADWENILLPLRSGEPGEITFIDGDMGSGKSTRGAGLASDPTTQRTGVDFFEALMACRSLGAGLVTRINATYRRTIPVASLREVAEHLAGSKALTVFFDEVQFLEQFPEGWRAAFTMCKALRSSGRDVFVTGLSVNFRGDPFILTANLMAIADHREHLQTTCKRCGVRGPTRPQRLWFGHPVPFNHPLFLPDVKGNVETGITYEARCSHCHQVPKVWSSQALAIQRALDQARQSGNRSRRSRRAS